MAGRYLLDTNVVVHLMNGSLPLPPAPEEIELCINIVVLGELHFGAQKSRRLTENLGRIGDFVRRVSVLSCDEKTAEIYGVVKARLRKKGKPIPENDIWIAASAFQHRLSLVTEDRHFREVEGLEIQWDLSSAR